MRIAHQVLVYLGLRADPRLVREWQEDRRRDAAGRAIGLVVGTGALLAIALLVGALILMVAGGQVRLGTSFEVGGNALLLLAAVAALASLLAAFVKAVRQGFRG